MSHLVLFFLILNLAQVSLEISFSEGSYCAGTIQLICGANHLTGSCMVRVFAGGCFRADLSCLIFFINIVFIIVSVLMSQDYRRVQMFSFLSIHANRWCFVAL